jgi:hypothetical protein
MLNVAVINRQAAGLGEFAESHTLSEAFAL